MPTHLLHTIGEELLDLGERILDEGRLRPVGRRMVDFGNITAPVEVGGQDCVSQLACMVGPIQPSLVTQAAQRALGKASCSILWVCRFTLVLLRCAEDEGTPTPEPDAINAEAHKTLQDAWQMSRGLAYYWNAKQMVPSYSFSCEDTEWFACTAIPRQGLLRGWQWPIEVTVHDRYIVEGS